MNDEDQEVPLTTRFLSIWNTASIGWMLVNRKSGRFAEKHTVSSWRKACSNTADMTEKQWIVNTEDQMKVILSCHDGKLGEFFSWRYEHAAAIRVLVIYFTSLLLNSCDIQLRWWSFWTRQDSTEDLFTVLLARYDKAHKRICKYLWSLPKNQPKEVPVLHPIAVKAEVWHQVGIDLVGPLTLTKNVGLNVVSYPDPHRSCVAVM